MPISQSLCRYTGSVFSPYFKNDRMVLSEGGSFDSGAWAASLPPVDAGVVLVAENAIAGIQAPHALEQQQAVAQVE